MGAFGLVWYDLPSFYPISHVNADGCLSSAKDQLTNQNVAVKKIMKPFSTPVLAKRTYRELKLLKHLKHENVGLTRAAMPVLRTTIDIAFSRLSRSATSSSHPSRTCRLMARRKRGPLADVSQLLCHRTPGHRSPQATHLEASREAVHSVLPLPDHGPSILLERAA